MVALIMFLLSGFTIFWAMIGYPIFLKVLYKLHKRKNEKNVDYEPTVTVMIVAHNEEKVIENKLDNIIAVDYPAEKLSVIVTSDFSTDATDEIVEKFIKEHPERNVKLHKAKEHKGKTNAQNEAAKLVKSEILVLSDANSMFEKNAIKELVSSFTDENIAYVTGKLTYVNDLDNPTASSEGFYWKLDLFERKVESEIQTITAGNGAIYAVRTKLYKDVDPIKCHDSEWPILYALDGKRAIYNEDAVAYEKAGETDGDEMKRKVRMNRLILFHILPNFKILNVFKYKWFSVFYLGHRTARYLLWLAHPIAFISNIFLARKSKVAKVTLVLQIVFYIAAILGKRKNNKNKITRSAWYYLMTVVAQILGVKNIITGKAKPTWSKAESTR